MSISADDLRRDVFFLASDEMGGRLVGTEGDELAGEFIADRYEELGLTPVGLDRSYRHTFELIVPRLGPDGSLRITSNDQTSSYVSWSDFFPSDSAERARRKEASSWLDSASRLQNLDTMTTATPTSATG